MTNPRLDALAREWYQATHDEGPRVFEDEIEAFKAGYLAAQAEAEKLADCAQELVEILSDSDSRKEIDSFTVQPLRAALADWRKFTKGE